jgi:pimeloyl-ACP methyl ester carboxylesterase
MKIMQKLAIRFTRLKFKVLAAFSKKTAAQKAFQLFCTPFAKPIKRVPPIFEKAELINFKLNGLNVRGYRWNRPQRHKILIIHGFASAAYKFSYYAEAFITKGYEVLAFDAPAHGNSEGKTVNALEYSAMIKKIIELYGPINSFMAHSFGGLALCLALENNGHENTKIVFIAPATETTSSLDIALKMLHLKNDGVRTEIDKVIFKIGGNPTEWYSMKRALQNIKAKILWFHDEGDEATPIKDALKVKEESFHNIQFIITKGLGHRKIYHDPEIKKQVVDFL